MQLHFAIAALIGAICSTCLAQVSVNGYTRRDGTYVQPYTRSAPAGGGSGLTGQAYGGGSMSGHSYGTRGGSGLGQNPGGLYAPALRPPAARDSFGNQGSGLGRTHTPSGNENTGRVQVDGHIRNNGTYVQPYTRTTPNRTDDDNWSKKGNLNLDTGKPGYKKDNPWK